MTFGWPYQQSPVWCMSERLDVPDKGVSWQGLYTLLHRINVGYDQTTNQNAKVTKHRKFMYTCRLHLNGIAMNDMKWNDVLRAYISAILVTAPACPPLRYFQWYSLWKDYHFLPIIQFDLFSSVIAFTQRFWYTMSCFSHFYYHSKFGSSSASTMADSCTCYWTFYLCSSCFGYVISCCMLVKWHIIFESMQEASVGAWTWQQRVSPPFRPGSAPWSLVTFVPP